MSNFINKYFLIILSILFVCFFLSISNIDAIEFDLRMAQESVGKRFASKFCEIKEVGFSSEASSEFALNNTYLKFVAFPDDDEFVDNLWSFTIEQIRKECGEYVTQYEENELKEFFEEEGEIASNRDLYLPNQ